MNEYTTVYWIRHWKHGHSENSILVPTICQLNTCIDLTARYLPFRNLFFIYNLKVFSQIKVTGEINMLPSLVSTGWFQEQSLTNLIKAKLLVSQSNLGKFA